MRLFPDFVDKMSIIATNYNTLSLRLQLLPPYLNFFIFIKLY